MGREVHTPRRHGSHVSYVISDSWVRTMVRTSPSLDGADAASVDGSEDRAASGGGAKPARGQCTRAQCFADRADQGQHAGLRLHQPTAGGRGGRADRRPRAVGGRGGAGHRQGAGDRPAAFVHVAEGGSAACRQPHRGERDLGPGAAARCAGQRTGGGRDRRGGAGLLGGGTGRDPDGCGRGRHRWRTAPGCGAVHRRPSRHA
jgi:hypothetical protein